MRQTKNTTHTRRLSPHLPALALLAFLVLVYLAPILPPFARGVRLGSDIANQYLPTLHLLREANHLHGPSRADDFIPLWNPYSFCGTPLIGNMQREPLFYPATWVYYFCPVESAIPWVEAIHLMLAAGGMYFLLFFYTRSRWAGLFAAVGWTFGGFFANRFLMGHLPQLEVCAYLPLLMLLLEGMLQAKRISRRSFALGAVGALCVFAGYPESLFMIVVILTLRFLAELAWRSRATDTEAVPARILLVNGAIALAVGGGLTAIQLLPALELIGLSARVHSTYAVAQARSMPPMNLLTFALPDFLGGIARRDAVQGAPIGEMSAYAGVTTLLLALAASFLRTLRDRPTRFYAGLALFGTLLSLGGNTPLYRLVFALPGFHQVAAPMRWAYSLAFALPVLAGLSIHTLLDLRVLERERLRRALYLTVAAALLAVLSTIAYALLRARIEHHYADLIVARYPDDAARRLAKLPAFCREQLIGLCAFAGLASATVGLLLWRQRTLTARVGRGFAVLLLALLVLDLAAFNCKDIQAIPALSPTLLAGGDYMASTELADEDTLRDDPARVLPLPDADAYPDQNLLTFALSPPASAVGYDPLELLSYRRMLDAWEAKPDAAIDARAPLIANWKSPLAERWNVRYLLTRTPLRDPAVRLVGVLDGVLVYRKNRCDPRVYVVHRTEKVADAEEAIQRMAHGEGGFPSGLAFVTGDSPALTSTAVAEPAERIVSLDQNWFRSASIFEVHSKGPGLLIISDNYYPGWRASDNRQEVSIVPVNGGMRGVYLKDGEHTISLRYDCPPLRIGAWISGGTLLFALLGLGVLKALQVRRLRSQSYSESISSSEISKLA